VNCILVLDRENSKFNSIQGANKVAIVVVVVVVVVIIVFSSKKKYHRLGPFRLLLWLLNVFLLDYVCFC